MGGGVGQERRGGETSWHNLGNYNFVTAWRGTGQNIVQIIDFLKREKKIRKEDTVIYIYSLKATLSSNSANHICIV